MEIKSTDLVSLYAKFLQGDKTATQLDEVGVVLQVSDNVCIVRGLNQAVYQELIEFEGGNQGIILDLNSGIAAIFLLHNHIAIKEQEVARRTGKQFTTPVGPGLLGRVLDVLGHPQDALGDLVVAAYQPIEAEIPGVIERSPVNQPLETGILAVDALVPVGLGQRELIIGNRGTGKTALVIDAILNQKNKSVICIYVSIGQQQAKLARIIKLLESTGALAYTVIVAAGSSSPVMHQYLAPYVGCTIAEYFRSQGQDVMIVYDDLTNHAIAYREMSLLLRRSPGREAYPGDVFYLHSRLLERAGKLLSGGSITALPIIQIQGGDLTAYIPTNLISITDGQIFLDTKLFNQGVRPAVNIELSVSRVGGAAQTGAMRQMTKALRLELAQYHELLSFAQFGTELDELSQRRLARGAIAVELLKQSQHQPYSPLDEVLILFAYQANFLDQIAVARVKAFVDQFISYTSSVHAELYHELQATPKISTEQYQRLQKIAVEFSKIFMPEAA